MQEKGCGSMTGVVPPGLCRPQTVPVPFSFVLFHFPPTLARNFVMSDLMESRCFRYDPKTRLPFLFRRNK